MKRRERGEGEEGGAMRGRGGEREEHQRVFFVFF
jgi:hypothetical protein